MPSVDEVLAGLSPAERIGQVIATSVGHHSGVMVNPPAPGDPDADAFWADHGTAMRIDREQTAELIERYALGGVCYFPGRLDGSAPDEVRSTLASLQAVAPLPLLVSTDQEGGAVARLRRGFTVFGSAMSMAATGDPSAVEEAAFVTGRELRAVGVAQVFSPVCDLNVNSDNPVIGTRSYGVSAGAVAPYLSAVIRGFDRAGVASTAKHFPGHGDTAVDSHVGLPQLTVDLPRWRRGEGASFAAAIASGVDAVMTGHLVLRAVDAVPATYSSAVIGGLLREELNFDGLVVTDALDMGGARGDVVAALRAGVDQLLMPPDVPATVAALTRALEDGSLAPERLEQACRRILIVKQRRGLLGLSSSALGVELGAHQEQAVALAARAVVVCGPAPTAVGDRVALRGDPRRVTRLAAALAEAGVTVDPDADRVVVLDEDAGPGELQVRTGVPGEVPDDRTVLLTYGDDDTALAGLVRVLRDPGAAGGQRVG